MRFNLPSFSKILFTATICCVLFACGGSGTDNSTSNLGQSVTAANNGIPAGITLLERVTADNDDLLIPYSKFQLDNGLTLVIHEDHSDPIVRVDVTYHVGSAREEPRRSGFAHFFEHMMFQDPNMLVMMNISALSRKPVAP